jgi:N-acetylmuramoyl-L-alanine amidase
MDRADGDKDYESNFYVLAHTSCPAVLTENMFQDNKLDVDWLLSDAGMHAIERLHVEGILSYIESLK